jgi:hypothetical protein
MNSKKIGEMAKNISEYFEELDNIETMATWKLHILYYGMDVSARPNFLKASKRSLVVNTLKAMNNSDAADCISQMESQMGYMITKIGEKKRKSIVGFLDKKTKLKFKIYQEGLLRKWDNGILDEYVIEEKGLPKHYPESMQECVECNTGYSVWDSAFTANCRKHSFHGRCYPKDGVCVKCEIEL